MDFKQAQESFKQLKAQYEAGTLDEHDFKSRLEELMVQDDQGAWWMIGYETEHWYRHDGTNWVQADPPAQKAEQKQRDREKADEAGALHYKGMIAQKERKYVEAELLYRQSLAIAVDLQDEQGKANILRQLAILSQERLDSEKRERENAEKASREKAEREAAEKAAREKARQEATERAARERSEREAAEKAAREKAERDARFKTTFEETGPKAAERTTQEKTGQKVAETPADVTKQNIDKLVTDKRSPWRRMLIGGGIGLILGMMTLSYSGVGAALTIMIAGGLAGLIIYPHKLSIIFLILGFLVGGFIASPDLYYPEDFLLGGAILGLPAGALLSRVLHWIKVLK